MTTAAEAADRPRAAVLAAPPEGDHRLLELVHHRRPQEDRRSSTAATALGVLRDRRHRGAADPAAARAARTARCSPPRSTTRMFTMHGTTMVFLVGMPLAVAFGNYLIPLQIGARDVAFPRLNMFGYWVVALRRPVHLLGLLPRRRAERRLVRLHAAHQHARSSARRAARPRPRLLGRRHRDARHRVDHVGDQLHRHHPQHARARA